MTLRGHITDYYEQGMEGDFWLCFQDEAPNDTVGLAGLRILSGGDQLTIFNPEHAVIWSGTIGEKRNSMVGECWFQLKQRVRFSRGNRTWYPEDFSRAEWIELFRERPCLKAEYVSSA